MLDGIAVSRLHGAISLILFVGQRRPRGAGPRPCQRIVTRTDTFIRPVRLIEWLRIATDAKNPRPRGNHHAFATVCIPWGDPVSRTLRAPALLEPWHRADCGAGRGDLRGRLSVCRQEPCRRTGHEAAADLYAVGRGGSASRPGGGGQSFWGGCRLGIPLCLPGHGGGHPPGS